MTSNSPWYGLLVIPLTILSCSQNPASLALPTNISTVAAGYPFALQIKNQMARHAHLTSVLVDLDRRNDTFQVRTISYGFASTNHTVRLFLISVDNSTRKAFAAMDSPDTPRNPRITPFVFQPLDLSNIHEVSEILEIARTNGLSEFCSLTSPQSGNVDLGLHNSQTGPVWSVQGDGWNEKGPIADLAILVDARTGAVLKRTLEKGKNRN